MNLEPKASISELALEPPCNSLAVDTALYSPAALFRACYAFTDRCYIRLKSSAPDIVTVEFRPRTADQDLRAVVGEFENELINQRLRVDIARETREIRELIVRKALAEARLHE
jgi:His-Xaa-Ser system protein HxsD